MNCLSGCQPMEVVAQICRASPVLGSQIDWPVTGKKQTFFKDGQHVEGNWAKCMNQVLLTGFGSYISWGKVAGSYGGFPFPDGNRRSLQAAPRMQRKCPCLINWKADLTRPSPGQPHQAAGLPGWDTAGSQPARLAAVITWEQGLCNWEIVQDIKVTSSKRETFIASVM